MPSKTNFETILKEEGELFYTNVGYSMYPLIKSREDILHISYVVVKTNSVVIFDNRLFLLYS